MSSTRGMSRTSRIIWCFAATGLLASALVFAYTRFSRVFHAVLVSRVVSDHSNSVALDSLQRRLRAGDIPNVHSVLVIQHDQVIAECYFEGTDEERGIPLDIVSFGPPRPSAGMARRAFIPRLPLRRSRRCRTIP